MPSARPACRRRGPARRLQRARPTWEAPGRCDMGREWGDGDCGCLASLPGWKLNPVVGAVYGPEFYAGTGWSRPSGPVGGVVRGRGQARGVAGARAGAWSRRCGWAGPGVAAPGGPFGLPALSLGLSSHRLFSGPLSCSDGVSLPHHGHSRCLQGRAPTGSGPGRV